MEKIAPTISASDALILQRLGEVGEEELDYIAEELKEPRGRVMHQLATLKKRGLVHVYNKYGELLISLTTKGRQAIRYLWPEAYAY